MAFYFYSHDIGLAKKTGITKVGFQLFKSINLQKRRFTIISHATKKSIKKEYNEIIHHKIKFQLLKYRTYLVKNNFKKAIMVFLNLFRYSLNSSKFYKNDIIIFNHIEYTSEFLNFLKNSVSKKVIWLHGTPEAYLNEKKTSHLIDFIVDAYNCADIVVHLNKTSLESWKLYGMKTRGIIINNTIEVKEPTKKIKNIDVLIIGSINERKGFNYLCENLELLNDIKFNINIIGKSKGDFADVFLQKINKLQNINYLGLVPDPENYISSAKLVWCLSKGEGQSLAMLESLEKGKPIISSNYPSAEDLIINNKNGYLVNNHSISDFIKFTDQLLFNKNMYNNFSNYSKKMFKTKFSNKIFNDNIKKLIKDATTNS